MSIVRVGSNEKFASGWEKAFGKKSGSKSSPAAVSAGKKAKPAMKKAASSKNKAAKKSAKK
ncbi:MAG: hypothetical protein SFX18_14660 [Pirellulales bacterium]|nr:hypothetical protein [Pirellulales bacterium]